VKITLRKVVDRLSGVGGMRGEAIHASTIYLAYNHVASLPKEETDNWPEERITRTVWLMAAALNEGFELCARAFPLRETVFEVAAARARGAR